MNRIGCEASRFLWQLYGRRRFLFHGAAVVAASLAGTRNVRADKRTVNLMNPLDAMEEKWSEKVFGSKTEYAKTQLDGDAFIRALSRGGASGLFRDVRYDLFEFPWLEWTWRADQVHQSADIRSRDREDYTASILLLFGRPSALQPKVKILGYAWTGEKTAIGDIVPSPLHPVFHRTIVLQSGACRSGKLLFERRNIARDFRLAFGRPPTGNVTTVALWTDSDQTGEEVVAYYGPIRAMRA